MMQKVDVETIAKDLVIMIGEQGHTEEGVVKYLNQYLPRQPVQVDEEEEQPPMDKETAGDMKYHALKDEGRLDEFGRRK